MPEVAEDVLSIRCEGEWLWGIVSRPSPAVAASRTGVLIVVGGPQYRVGSHRQFVLLARGLAVHGHAVLRFDYRGMGDSTGELRTFEHVEADLDAAVAALHGACPQVDRIVVWGLCDAASAAMMYARTQDSLAGLVVVNPWARSAASLAAAQVKHYYGQRLLQREFWAKLLRGGVDWRASLGAACNCVLRARSLGRRGDGRDASFQQRMADGLRRFNGPTLLVLSGNDLTAKEFLEYTGAAPEWAGLLQASGLTRVDMPDADHTFSRREWMSALERATIDWLRGVDAVGARATASR